MIPRSNLLLLLWGFLLSSLSAAAEDEQYRIVITNDSGSPMDIFWVEPETLNLLKMNADPLPPVSSTPYFASAGDEFEVQERPEGGECREGVCRRTLIKVTGSEEDEFVLINDQFEAQRFRDPNSPNPIDSKMSVLNKSGSSIDLYWINPVGGQAHQMTAEAPLRPGKSLTLNTFQNHLFEVRQQCELASSSCKTTRFQNPQNDDEPTIMITRQFQALHQGTEIGLVSNDANVDTNSWAGLFEHCQQHSKSTNDDDDYCVQQHLGLRILQTQERLAFEQSLREDVAAKLENYTCSDNSLETSPPIRIEEWQHPQEAVRRQVDVMFDRPASKIHLVHNFISEEECQAMETAAQDKLGRGTVADGNGGLRISDHRKAMQAAIAVDWDKEGDPIARMSHRVYDYVNHVLHLNITELGQEELMSIQYEGRGFEDSAPDQYKPHCDGDCDGLPHKNGTRMATMVMYCKLPIRGGHTNFQNAHVHVKPQQYMAAFFSYMDPKTHLMDTRFTEHSGCPVWEGHKKIVTQWVRYGVDQDNPWSTFNTNGVKISEADDW